MKRIRGSYANFQKSKFLMLGDNAIPPLDPPVVLKPCLFDVRPLLPDSKC